jgi:predicted DsbA family dithiol-disulfide isomerase
MQNSHIKADAVEIMEFPHLAQKYRVRGVPKVVINEHVQFEGAVPEKTFLAQVLKAQGD